MKKILLMFVLLGFTFVYNAETLTGLVYGEYLGQEPVEPSENICIILYPSQNRVEYLALTDESTMGEFRQYDIEGLPVSIILKKRRQR